MEFTSEKLYSACLAGDEIAWSYVYTYVLNWLRRYKAEPKDIEDIAQETVAYMIDRGIDNVKEKKAFKSLLRKKTWGMYMDFYKKKYHSCERQAEGSQVEKAGPFSQDRTNPDSLDQKIFYDQILGLTVGGLNRLEKKCREALWTYYRGRLTGETVKEMARHLDIKPNTLSKRLTLCREKAQNTSEYQKILAMYRER